MDRHIGREINIEHIDENYKCKEGMLNKDKDRERCNPPKILTRDKRKARHMLHHVMIQVGSSSSGKDRHFLKKWLTLDLTARHG